MSSTIPLIASAWVPGTPSQSTVCFHRVSAAAVRQLDFQPQSEQAGGARLLSLTRGVRVGASGAPAFSLLYLSSPEQSWSLLLLPEWLESA